MENNNTLENKITTYIEANKNFILAKKAFIDVKINKKLNLVNDYKDFYYISERKKTTDSLYSQINNKTLNNKRFPLLKIDAALSIIKLNYKEKSIKKNPILDLKNNKEKSAIILNSSKGGFNIFYKGLIGFLPKNQMLKSLKNKINYTQTFLKLNNDIPKTNITVTKGSLNIYFQNIKYNFAQIKKRKINNIETSIIFTNEKDRKNIKTKDNKQFRK